MQKIQCPEPHTDTYIVPENELQEMKDKNWVKPNVEGLLGCNKCEDFYELVKNKINSSK